MLLKVHLSQKLHQELFSCSGCWHYFRLAPIISTRDTGLKNPGTTYPAANRKGAPPRSPRPLRLCPFRFTNHRPSPCPHHQRPALNQNVARSQADQPEINFPRSLRTSSVSILLRGRCRPGGFLTSRKKSFKWLTYSLSAFNRNS